MRSVQACVSVRVSEKLTSDKQQKMLQYEEIEEEGGRKEVRRITALKPYLHLAPWPSKISFTSFKEERRASVVALWESSTL